MNDPSRRLAFDAPAVRPWSLEVGRVAGRADIIPILSQAFGGR